MQTSGLRSRNAFSVSAIARTIALRSSALALSAIACAAAGCSSSSASPVESNDAGAGAGDSGSVVTEQGTLYDYGSLLAGQMSPVRGLTIASGGQTATTDSKGHYTLQQPLGQLVNGVASGTSSSDPYAELHMPELILSGNPADRGDIILPDVSTLQTEQQVLSADPSKAVVNLLLLPSGACTSAEGATVKVNSPAGAEIQYIDATGYPRAQQKSVAALASPWRAAVAIFNVAVGTPLDISVTHPTCKQVPFPSTYKGVTFTGKVVTKPLSDNASSALIIVLEAGDADAGAADAAAD